MKYFSMFSGIGGFELGIQRAFDNRPDIRNGAESLPEDSTDTKKPQARAVCVGYSEIDKYAIKVYERQFKHDNYGDATKIDAGQLPDFDLLVGGFPCQAFSIAGKRAGFNDTRGTLFFDIARILKEKQPQHLVLENVKGLLSHDSGRTFTTIIGVLTDLGYLVEWQVLNSKDFGVPQNRERVYIVGHLGNECGRKVFPISGNDSQTIESGLATVSAVTGVSPTLNTMQGGNRQPFIAAINAVNKGEKVRQQGRRIKNHEEPTFTLNTIDQVGVTDGVRIRRLTPKECERLQGFPDNWTKYGKEITEYDSDPTFEKPIYKDVEISDTQRYKMCGNAVTVNTVEAVMKSLIQHSNIN